MTDALTKFVQRHDATTDPDAHEQIHDELYAFLGKTTDVDAEHTALDVARTLLNIS